MRVTNILVTHSIFPEKLLASTRDAEAEVRWMVYFHGHDDELKKRIGDAVAALGGAYFPYGEDRGLARSWNEALIASRRDGADLALLLNDDLFFYPGGFADFIAFSQAAQANDPSVGVVHTNGLESGGSPYAGTVQTQGFACCAVLDRAIDAIGYFDVNFTPAYFEDADYARRLFMAGLGTATDPRTLVEHERGLTSRLDPELAANNAAIAARCANYFYDKWGCNPGGKGFERPFDDPSLTIMISEADALVGPRRDPRRT